MTKGKIYLVEGRRGQYELSTADGKSHCFFMDDTDDYEYFPIDTKIKELVDKEE